MVQHQFYLDRCIELARLGAGSVSPNPMVGAVIVCDNQIIGEGYHMAYGHAHAEVNAINNVFENNLTYLKVGKNVIMLLVVRTATEEVPKPVNCRVKMW